VALKREVCGMEREVCGMVMSKKNTSLFLDRAFFHRQASSIFLLACKYFHPSYYIFVHFLAPRSHYEGTLWIEDTVSLP
jgi:hypothetical protein